MSTTWHRWHVAALAGVLTLSAIATGTIAQADDVRVPIRTAIHTEGDGQVQQVGWGWHGWHRPYGYSYWNSYPGYGSYYGPYSSWYRPYYSYSFYRPYASFYPSYYGYYGYRPFFYSSYYAPTYSYASPYITSYGGYSAFARPAYYGGYGLGCAGCCND